jgi:catechol 2,3-dioxygenase-like lactoylglutathione lyase family enzyme
MRSRTKEMWWGTALEAPDPATLAAFYSGLLDWPVVNEQGGAFIVRPPQDSVFLVIQPAENYLPPAWPPVSGAQRTMMHLDIEVADLDEAVAEAVALGARIAGFQPNDNVRVLLDPAGHPFCLCRDDAG